MRDITDKCKNCPIKAYMDEPDDCDPYDCVVVGADGIESLIPS